MNAPVVARIVPWVVLERIVTLAYRVWPDPYMHHDSNTDTIEFVTRGEDGEWTTLAKFTGPKCLPAMEAALRAALEP